MKHSVTGVLSGAGFQPTRLVLLTGLIVIWLAVHLPPALKLYYWVKSLKAGMRWMLAR